MSTAHRPTWDPAQAKDVKGGSRQFSVRDMAAHTKLKFRYVILITHEIRCLTYDTVRSVKHHQQKLPDVTSALSFY